MQSISTLLSLALNSLYNSKNTGVVYSLLYDASDHQKIDRNVRQCSNAQLFTPTIISLVLLQSPCNTLMAIIHCSIEHSQYVP